VISDTSDHADHDHNHDNHADHAAGPATEAGPLRLRTVMSWHPADEDRVTRAFVAALEALHERARSSRFILEDPHAYGLADPEKLRHQISADDRAALVIRSVLDGRIAPDPQ
jgi:hypothetical protein